MGAFFSFLQYYTTISSSNEEKLSEKCDPNAALAQELRGQRIRLDPTKSFQNWPMGDRHKDYERLRGEANRILEL